MEDGAVSSHPSWLRSYHRLVVARDFAVSFEIMASALTKPDGLDPQEGALLDIVRLAIRGDSRSLRQRVRNLLRGGNDPVLTEPARHYLSRLLTDSDASAPMRTTASGAPTALAGVPRDDQTAAPLMASEWPEAVRAPVLPEALHRRIDRITREHQMQEVLAASGLAPTARILLTGAPGTGKTMTALHLAGRLGLPLLRAEPSVIMTSLLGQSARNIAKMFTYAGQQPCVLLLDELDAYARSRDDAYDIAEPKRLVNTLLLELDRWPAGSVLIAATNHPELLDHAITRRFETVVALPLPDHEARRRIVGEVLADHGWHVDERILEVIAAATDGASGSDVRTGTLEALRVAVLDKCRLESTLIDQFVRGQMTGRSARARQVREVLAMFCHEVLGLTQREIAELLDVSHVTVGNMVRAKLNKR
jgi:hypothetical protein